MVAAREAHKAEKRAAWVAVGGETASKTQKAREVTTSTLAYRDIQPAIVLRYERCDGTRLCKQDRMVYDLLTIFQPRCSKVIFEGKLYINGECTK